MFYRLPGFTSVNDSYSEGLLASFPARPELVCRSLWKWCTTAEASSAAAAMAWAQVLSAAALMVSCQWRPGTAAGAATLAVALATAVLAAEAGGPAVPALTTTAAATAVVALTAVAAGTAVAIATALTVAIAFA